MNLPVRTVWLCKKGTPASAGHRYRAGTARFAPPVLHGCRVAFLFFDPVSGSHRYGVNCYMASSATLCQRDQAGEHGGALLHPCKAVTCACQCQRRTMQKGIPTSTTRAIQLSDVKRISSSTAIKMACREIRAATIAAYESGVSSHFKVELL